MDTGELSSCDTVVSEARSFGSTTVVDTPQWSTAMGGGSRIMIVDDDRAFVEALAIYLEDHNFNVTKAHSAQEALNACFKKKFDMAVIDVHLPDGAGTELALALSQWHPSIPILLISSDDSPETASKCLAAKVHAFMAKPLIPRQLLETITAACVQARMGQTSSTAAVRRHGD